MDVDAVVEVVNGTNPGIFDRPGEAKTLVHPDTGRERPFPRTGGIKRIAVI